MQAADLGVLAHAHGLGVVVDKRALEVYPPILGLLQAAELIWKVSEEQGGRAGLGRSGAITWLSMSGAAGNRKRECVKKSGSRNSKEEGAKDVRTWQCLPEQRVGASLHGKWQSRHRAAYSQFSVGFHLLSMQTVDNAPNARPD